MPWRDMAQADFIGYGKYPFKFNGCKIYLKLLEEPVKWNLARCNSQFSSGVMVVWI